MTPESRAGHEAAESERSRVNALARHERKLRERERRRIATLVGPGHNYDLAPDAPEGADARFDNTGFSDGVL